MSDKEFIIERIVLCEYNTQDANGRQIFMGVYEPTTYIQEAQPLLPSLFIAIAVQPLADQFEFVVEFVGPQKIMLVRGTFEPKFSGPAPQHIRINVAFNLPPLPFPGPGDYHIIVRNKSDRVVSSQIYRFELGDPSLNPGFDMAGKVELNRDYINALQRPIS